MAHATARPRWLGLSELALNVQSSAMFALASKGVVWLIANRKVQPEQRPVDLRTVARAALGGLLALLLLLATTVSVSHALHQTVHQGSVGSHLCLACSLAKGQVTPADAGLVTAVLLFVWFLLVRVAAAVRLPDVAYRLSHSRAPPIR